MEFAPFLGWIGSAALGVLSLIGVAKIIENSLARRWQKKDEREDIHRTNFGKQIEADSVLNQKILEDQSERLKRLEDKFETLQTEYNSQMKKAAHIEAENLILKEKEQRQESEINELKKSNQKQATEIINLRSELLRTQQDLDYYKREFSALSERVERMSDEAKKND